MKKAAILRIPFHTVAAASGKKHQYNAAGYIEEIKGEQHLFIDIYDNTGHSMPLVRLVYTEKDWGIYWPEDNKWSGAGIPEWGPDLAGNRRQEIKMPEKDIQRIRNFCKKRCRLPSYRTGTKKWEPWVYALQEKIKDGRRCRKMQARERALQERIENTPPLPDDLEKWADRRVFGSRHFIYYKRRGRYCEVACSFCGEAAAIAVKRLDTYEGQFEHVMDTPVHGQPGICPLCRDKGIYMASGRVKTVYENTGYFYVAQAYKNTGAVIRYFYAKKEFQIELMRGGKHHALHSASEKIILKEQARIYIEQGKKIQIQEDFCKYDPYTGQEFWDDSNLPGFRSYYLNAGAVYEKSYENLKGTVLQYSGAEEYSMQHAPKYKMSHYMETYFRYPQLEMFVKMKLFGIVDKLIRSEFGILADMDSQNPAECLGIHKNRLKYLSSNRGDIELLRILQLEKRLNASWTDREVEFLKTARPDRTKLALATSHMGMERFMNKMKKYAGCDTDDGILCSSMEARIKHTTDTYLDYLDMRDRRGYDLSNTVYLYPKDLDAAHQKMVSEINKDELDKRIMEVSEKYPHIKENYRKLRKQFYYEDGTYIIRPARSAGEIVEEGRQLHHCVGGDSYLFKHDQGESYILFLRFKEMPEVPYITVEIKPDCSIKQWYGAHDKKPDQKNMQKWIDAYVLRLICKNSCPQAGKATAVTGLATMA